MQCGLKGSELHTHDSEFYAQGSEFYAQSSEFYAQGSDLRQDKQCADEIKILDISPFKCTLFLIKYDIYDSWITRKVTDKYVHFLNTL